MKQLFVVVLALISFTTFAQTDFRKAKWGMSKLQIKKIESAELVAEAEDVILYSSKLASLETDVGYSFVGGKLIVGSYRLTEKHTNKNDYIRDYETLKGLLTKKYGSPIVDKITWKNDLYKGDIQDYGMAISIGHLTYFCKWTTDRTEIIFVLYGDNYEVSNALKYSSIELKDFEQKAREDAVLDDF